MLTSRTRTLLERTDAGLADECRALPSGRTRQPVENITSTLLKTAIHSCVTTISVITDRITVSFFLSVVKI